MNNLGAKWRWTKWRCNSSEQNEDATQQHARSSQQDGKTILQLDLIKGNAFEKMLESMAKLQQ